eukprot:INCI550.1.p1 GENE.INCI550.1~~INCI550.1.p1  ORF type:complete len:167 (+),score=17.58 INCI550.1:98-598(+)
MPQDETTLKCSEINVKEPKTWAWVAAIITSLLLFFTAFSLLNNVGCTCDYSFVYSLLVGIFLLCLCFLCILRCCACSSAFAIKVTPFTQNYWFKAGVYGGVGILGLIIYGVENCCSGGIAAIYVISALAGVLFLVLGFMNRGNKLNNENGPNYTGNAVTEGAYQQS